jgi:hypothetical protein
MANERALGISFIYAAEAAKVIQAFFHAAALNSKQPLRLTRGRNAPRSSRPPAIQTQLDQEDGGGEQDQFCCGNADEKARRRCARPVKID